MHPINEKRMWFSEEKKYMHFGVKFLLILWPDLVGAIGFLEAVDIYYKKNSCTSYLEIISKSP